MATTNMSVELVPMSVSDKESQLMDIEGAEECKSGYEAIIPENTPVVLTWKDLSVRTRSANENLQKPLIDHLSGSITGGFWAIMGSSGSGKSIILSLSCFLFYRVTQ